MQKYSSVITIERFLIQNFANYRTMAEISTAKNRLPKSPTELEKDGTSFSSLFSLGSACAMGDSPFNSHMCTSALKVIEQKRNRHFSTIWKRKDLD